MGRGSSSYKRVLKSTQEHFMNTHRVSQSIISLIIKIGKYYAENIVNHLPGKRLTFCLLLCLVYCMSIIVMSRSRLHSFGLSFNLRIH